MRIRTTLTAILILISMGLSAGSSVAQAGMEEGRSNTRVLRINYSTMFGMALYSYGISYLLGFEAGQKYSLYALLGIGGAWYGLSKTEAGYEGNGEQGNVPEEAVALRENRPAAELPPPGYSEENYSADNLPAYREPLPEGYRPPHAGVAYPAR